MTWKNKPSIADLKRLGRILAGIDIVISYESPDIAYFIYTPDLAGGIDCFRVDNGAGDNAVALFGPDGAIIKAFDHESRISPYQRKDRKPWPGLYEGVPQPLLAYLDLDEAQKGDVTYCIYRELKGPWKETTLVKPPADLMTDGSWLLSQIHETAKDWLAWGEDYYEAEFALKDLAEVYREARITPELAGRLLQGVNCERPLNFEKIRPRLSAIGMTE